MPTTRTPLQPAAQCELFHTVGSHVYLVRYPEGQEDRARECTYRFVRNPELAFTWADAADMCEALPDPPLACDEDCNCDACVAERHFDETWDLRIDNARLWWEFQGAKTVIGLLLTTIAFLIWRTK
jgi:hypothetical protein